MSSVLTIRHCERSDAIQIISPRMDCFVAHAPRNDGKLFPQNHLLDITQLFLAEEDFLADKESRRAERAALDCGLCVLDQLRLDVGIPGAREQFDRIDAGRYQ